MHVCGQVLYNKDDNGQLATLKMETHEILDDNMTIYWNSGVFILFIFWICSYICI